MTNVESMDYTHSHPSTIASLSNTAHFSPVLPPFLFSLHIRFGQSQTLSTLTKFIEKDIKIHNMKSILLDAS